MAQPDRGWLNNDPAAIWHRPPGFYQDSGQWYAILHARPDIRRVRLVGDFIDATGGVDLTSTPVPLDALAVIPTSVAELTGTLAATDASTKARGRSFSRARNGPGSGGEGRMGWGSETLQK